MPVYGSAGAVAVGSSKEYESLGLRLHANSPFICYVFVKHHKSQDAGENMANALYVTGLPLGLDEEVSLQSIFSVFGAVANVVVHPTKRSAALVYENSSDIHKALSHASTGQIIECALPLPEGPLGLKSWVAAHKAQRPGNEQLQKQLDDWVESHEAAEAAEAARAAARQAAMAEDGWTVVVRSKGRKRARESGGVSVVTGGIAQAAAAAARAASESKAKQAENFYRFQQRDKRRNELLDLREKFEEGRRRLAALKAARNFKPQ